MRRLDCITADCGLSFSSPTEAAALNALVKHCLERHPDDALDAATIQAARDSMTWVSTPVV